MLQAEMERELARIEAVCGARQDKSAREQYSREIMRIYGATTADTWRLVVDHVLEHHEVGGMPKIPEFVRGYEIVRARQRNGEGLPGYHLPHDQHEALMEREARGMAPAGARYILEDFVEKRKTKLPDKIVSILLERAGAEPIDQARRAAGERREE